jgi:hypothetical protein
MQNLIIKLVFKKNANFFTKIGENRRKYFDNNIDPRSPWFSPLFSCKKFEGNDKKKNLEAKNSPQRFPSALLSGSRKSKIFSRTTREKNFVYSNKIPLLRNKISTCTCKWVGSKLLPQDAARELKFRWRKRHFSLTFSFGKSLYVGQKFKLGLKCVFYFVLNVPLNFVWNVFWNFVLNVFWNFVRKCVLELCLKMCFGTLLEMCFGT